MDEKGLRYRKADNRFTWLEDFHKAQELADRQLRTDWVSLCEQLRKRYHPLHEKIARPLGGLSDTGQPPRLNSPATCCSMISGFWTGWSHA